MSQANVQAWWVEVEHLRERIERRRSESVPAPESRPRPRASATTHRAEHDGRGHDSSFSPRRTVRIRGQAIPTVTAPRLRPVEDSQYAPERTAVPATSSARRRPPSRPSERLSASPDRLALWAFAIALLLLLVAAISAHGL